MSDIYREYFQRFNDNDNEEVVQYVPNSDASEFLLENAPRLYCPDKTIEETFAFRTWSIRKHIQKTEDGFLLSEFLVNEKLPWAGKHNTINAALTHHLNEFRWFKNADILLDYIDFFIKGEGSVHASKSAFAYHTPALTAIYNYCMITANEQYLKDNAADIEEYFKFWEERHLTKNGLYWSIDDREGTEYSISGTTPELKMIKGFRPLMNACMYGDAVTMAKIFALAGDDDKREFYLRKAESIKQSVESKLWDGEFFKAIHPYHQELDRDLDYNDIPAPNNARELMGYIPWAFALPSRGKEHVFKLLKDDKVFSARTGLTTADMGNPRFLFYDGKACTWNGNVWPYATSYAINAVIELLNNYDSAVMTNEDLYDLTKKYAQMHYSNEDGKVINFIDEVMLPFEHIWYARERAKTTTTKLTGGKNRGRDYNHSTFIDLILRGLCGIDVNNDELTVKPRIDNIWKWFKLENLTYRNNTYTIYYDQDGSVFGKGCGVIIEK